MKQLELFKDVDEKEIQLRKRPAATLKSNSACGKVTNRMKLEGGSRWVTTKVKVLGPKITIISEVDTVHIVEDNMLTTAKGEEVSTPTGSKAGARQQKDSVGTRQNHSIPQKGT